MQVNVLISRFNLEYEIFPFQFLVMENEFTIKMILKDIKFHEMFTAIIPSADELEIIAGFC